MSLLHPKKLTLLLLLVARCQTSGVEHANKEEDVEDDDEGRLEKRIPFAFFEEIYKQARRDLDDLHPHRDLQSRNTHFPVDPEAFKTSGKNVMAMIDKIEGLLKEDAKKSTTSERQSPFSGARRRVPKPPPKRRYQFNSIPKRSSVSTGYGADETYPPLDFSTKEHDKSQVPDLKLDIEDYKHIWLNMLYAVHQILHNDDLLKESVTNTKTLEKIFYLLQDVNLLDYRRDKIQRKCPYSYDKAGKKLCLSAEFIEETLSWEDARLYCQVVKGGDLVIFKDACEFTQTLEYIKEIDPESEFSYWFGGTDLDTEGVWKYIDGTVVPLGSPLWGKRLGVQEPSNEPFDQDYGVLLARDNYLMHDVSNSLAVKTLPVKPLCQYIPERDGLVFRPKKPSGWGPYAAFKRPNSFKFYGENDHGYGADEGDNGGVSGGYGSSGGGGIPDAVAGIESWYDLEEGDIGQGFDHIDSLIGRMHSRSKMPKGQ